ncbi:MAG TPA: ABC transporter permease [Chloroflexi bacterium]|nr:ABC transporter permease [Chloroflexota bacterium]
MKAFSGHRRRSKLALGGVATVVYAFLYLPLVIVFVYAFDSATITSWPPSSPSLHWFNVLFNDPEPKDAFVNSIQVAVAATLIAVMLGTAAAFAVQRFRFPGRELLNFGITLPILLPGIITGVAMTTWFSQLIQWGVLDSLSLVTVTIGHATFCIVLVFNNVLARLHRTTRSLEEASMDLGADGWQTFWRVTMPSIRGAVIAGALLAFTLSFDEIIVTFFLIGPQNTLPLWILGHIRLGQNFPEIDAAAVCVIAISAPIVLLSQYFTREPRAATALPEP